MENKKRKEPTMSFEEDILTKQKAEIYCAYKVQQQEHSTLEAKIRQLEDMDTNILKRAGIINRFWDLLVTQLNHIYNDSNSLSSDVIESSCPLLINYLQTSTNLKLYLNNDKKSNHINNLDVTPFTDLLFKESEEDISSDFEDQINVIKKVIIDLLKKYNNNNTNSNDTEIDKTKDLYIIIDKEKLNNAKNEKIISLLKNEIGFLRGKNTQLNSEKYSLEMKIRSNIRKETLVDIYQTKHMNNTTITSSIVHTTTNPPSNSTNIYELPTDNSIISQLTTDLNKQIETSNYRLKEIEKLRQEKLELEEKILHFQTFPNNYFDENTIKIHFPFYENLLNEFNNIKNENFNLKSQITSLNNINSELSEKIKKELIKNNSDKKTWATKFLQINSELEKKQENILSLKKQVETLNNSCNFYKSDSIASILSKQYNNALQSQLIEIQKLKLENNNLSNNIDNITKTPGISVFVKNSLINTQKEKLKSGEEDEITSLKEINNELTNEIDRIYKLYTDAQNENSVILEKNKEALDEINTFFSIRSQLMLNIKKLENEKDIIYSINESQKEKEKLLSEKIKEFENLNSFQREELSKIRDELLSQQARSLQQITAAKEIQSQSEIIQDQLNNYKAELSKTFNNMKTILKEKESKDNLINRQKEQLEFLSRNTRKELIGSSDFQDLEYELEKVKKELTCSVCTRNKKDTVISKCFHCFCRACINQNLNTRLRKCPACGKSFGSEDVHQLFLMNG